VATFTLKTSSSATTPGQVSAITAVSAVTMVSTSSRKILSDAAGFVSSVSSAGAAAAAGKMAVEAIEFVGLQAYVDAADEQEFVNTAHFAGAPAHAPTQVKVLAVKTCHAYKADSTTCAEGSTKTDVTTSAACASGAEDALALDGDCNTVLDASMAGGGDVVVTASYAALETSATLFRVWVPEAVEVHVADRTLNAIAFNATGCSDEDDDASWYQWTSATATARLAGPITLANVDVTDLVKFALDASGSAVAAVRAGGVLQGLAAGSGVLGLACAAGAPACDVAPAEFVVSDVAVRLSSLEAYVLSGVELDGSFVVPATAAAFADANATAAAVQRLSTEGATARVYSFVHFSDDASEYAGARAGITVELVGTSSLVVVNATAPAELQVPVGATQHVGSDFVRVALARCGADQVTGWPCVSKRCCVTGCRTLVRAVTMLAVALLLLCTTSCWILLLLAASLAGT
jgi:hypothetical protein